MGKPKKTILNDSENLTPKQKDSLPHFIGARSIEAGCRSAKVSKATFFAWIKQKTFRDALSELREEIFRDALNQLKAGFGQGVEELLKLCTDKAKNIRIKAIIKNIDSNLRIWEMEEVESRLRRIEEALEGRK